MCVCVRKKNAKHAYRAATDRAMVSAIQTDVRERTTDRGTQSTEQHYTQPIVRKNVLGNLLK